MNEITEETKLYTFPNSSRCLIAISKDKFQYPEALGKALMMCRECEYIHEGLQKGLSEFEGVQLDYNAFFYFIGSKEKLVLQNEKTTFSQEGIGTVQDHD